MKKTILAVTTAIVATLSFASVSEAGWRHHHNHFGGFNFVIDASPRYVVDDYGYDEPDCYIKKTKRYNKYGELVIKKVQICD